MFSAAVIVAPQSLEKQPGEKCSTEHHRGKFDKQERKKLVWKSVRCSLSNLNLWLTDGLWPLTPAGQCRYEALEEEVVCSVWPVSLLLPWWESTHVHTHKHKQSPICVSKFVHSKAIPSRNAVLVLEEFLKTEFHLQWDTEKLGLYEIHNNISIKMEPTAILF